MVTLIKTDAEFDAALSAAGDTLVLVDFYADWCGPCKKIAPTLQTMAEKEFTDVKFLKVNVDDLEELSGKYGVKAMPTFLFFKNGKKIAEVVGANEKNIRDAINANK